MNADTKKCKVALYPSFTKQILMNVFDGILEVFYENMQNAQDNV